MFKYIVHYLKVKLRPESINVLSYDSGLGIVYLNNTG